MFITNIYLKFKTGVHMKSKISYYILLLILPIFISGIINDIEHSPSLTGIDIYVYKSGYPVENALVRVSGNNFLECCYSSGAGKCRVQTPADGTYGFCASKDHYGDSKSVYISGGTAIVYMYLNTYGLECQACEDPEKIKQ